jgi:hypothetical protein
MSQDVTILKKQPDNTYKYIYIKHHHPPLSLDTPNNKSVGELLLEVYNTPKKIDELFELGGMAILEPTIEASRRLAHFSHPETYPTLEETIKNKITTSYSYLFQDNTWYIDNYDPTKDKEKFIPLKEYIEQTKKETQETKDRDIALKEHLERTYWERIKKEENQKTKGPDMEM